jgi:short-subunit dehydrogenase
MKLAQASVVLTGAAGGIGAPTARALVAAGARVLLVGRDGGRLASLASDLLPADDRTRVDWLAADLTTPAGIEAVRAAALARRANVLVNNAGIASFGRLGALGEAHIEQVIATNLLAPMLLTRALLPGLQAQTEAAVLNLSLIHI